MVVRKLGSKMGLKNIKEVFFALMWFFIAIDIFVSYDYAAIKMTLMMGIKYDLLKVEQLI